MTRSPRPNPGPMSSSPKWQCMWGCGKSSHSTKEIREHEKKCEKKP